jgi:hypothetical protein
MVSNQALLGLNDCIIPHLNNLVATALIAQEPESVPRSEVAPRLLHLPIHSVDGQHIGVVTQAAIGGGEAVFIGEVERPLGLGPEEPSARWFFPD